MIRDDEKVAGLAVTFGEVREFERQSAIGRKSGDGRVCLCGHPFNRHSEVRGVTVCRPSRLTCRCRDQAAALEVQDTRVFLRKTTGVGREHALVRGIVAATELEHTIAWLIPVECARCGAKECTPAGLKKASGSGGSEARIAREDESPEATRLLCAECLRGFS